MRNPSRLIVLHWILLSVLMVMSAAGCKKPSTPKPQTYFRIDFPPKEYRTFSGDCPFSFEYPVYGIIAESDVSNAEPCWYNIEFPSFKAKIYLTYKPVHQNLPVFMEDIRSLAYKHIIKADDIIDMPFCYPERRVYGIVYDIRGNTASSVSFFATDSVRNFLSGSLYFNVQPNIDSLSPVINFFRKDIEHLIETLTWN